jgi:tight adherence protein C
MIFLLVVFVAVAGVVLVACCCSHRPRLCANGCRRSAQAKPSAGADGRLDRARGRVAQPFSKLSLPEEGWERSPLRTRFINAGWRNPSAPALYFAAKTVLALLLPAMVPCAGGSSSPNVQAVPAVLCCARRSATTCRTVCCRRTADHRKPRDLREPARCAGFADVCVEAGLSMERALGKVAGEIHIKAVVLAQELQLVLMEMRAGFSKEKALRNFALRSGVEDVDTLVAMLIQSERFGTSMGDSLRVHSDNLRLKRSLLAEEAAAKIALKLLFPLIFCIFPDWDLLMVLLSGAT